MQRPSAEARDGHYIAYSGWRDRCFAARLPERWAGSQKRWLCDAAFHGRVIRKRWPKPPRFGGFSCPIQSYKARTWYFA